MPVRHAAMLPCIDFGGEGVCVKVGTDRLGNRQGEVTQSTEFHSIFLIYFFVCIHFILREETAVRPTAWPALGFDILEV